MLKMLNIMFFVPDYPVLFSIGTLIRLIHSTGRKLEVPQSHSVVDTLAKGILWLRSTVWHKNWMSSALQIHLTFIPWTCMT